VRLYGYFRSSAAYRVRIALNLKGLPYDAVAVDLLANAQRDPGYLVRNPQGLVPALETDDGVLGQSLAIIEYLDEVHPEPALLPPDPWQRARARSLAYAIACDTHPLNNLRVLNYLTREAGLSEAGRRAWMVHWMQTTFAALEDQVDAAPFCLGERVTLADLCLVPQLFNARRFEVDLAPYPRLIAVEAAMNAIPAVQAAHPSRQADAIGATGTVLKQ
jgi:maleylacetoacetate isomerase